MAGKATVAGHRGYLHGPGVLRGGVGKPPDAGIGRAKAAA